MTTSVDRTTPVVNGRGQKKIRFANLRARLCVHSDDRRGGYPVRDASEFRVLDVIDSGDAVDVHIVVRVPFRAMQRVIETAERLADMARVVRQREERRPLARVLDFRASARPDTSSESNDT